MNIFANVSFFFSFSGYNASDSDSDEMNDDEKQ